jgi:hypothetical protein
MDGLHGPFGTDWARTNLPSHTHTTWPGAPSTDAHAPELLHPSSFGVLAALSGTGRSGVCMRSTVIVWPALGASKLLYLPATPLSSARPGWARNGVVGQPGTWPGRTRPGERSAKNCLARRAARFSAMSSSSAALERAEMSAAAGISQGAPTPLADDRRERAPAGDDGKPPWPNGPAVTSLDRHSVSPLNINGS